GVSERRAGIEIRVRWPPRKGPRGRARRRHPLDDGARGGECSGLQKSHMGTIPDLGGRYAAYTTRLADGVLTTPGHTPPALRRAVMARAAGQGGADVAPALA